MTSGHPEIYTTLTDVTKRSWMYEKRVLGGPKRKHSLGTWPAMSLADARAVALEIQAEAERGIDRIADAEIAKLLAERNLAAQKSVSDALDRYEQLKLTNLRTGQERARELRKALHEYLDRPIEELFDIQERHEEGSILAFYEGLVVCREKQIPLPTWLHAGAPCFVDNLVGVEPLLKPIGRIKAAEKNNASTIIK